VPDWKGLKGDPSDNIPGVPGVGDKTASRLLQLYGSMEGIYEHLSEVTPPRMQELLRQHQEQGLWSKRLATISRDVPVTLDLDACHLRSYDRAKVVRLLRDLEFTSLLGRLPDQQAGPNQGVQLGLLDLDQGPPAAGVQVSKDLPDGKYLTVQTTEQLEAVVRRISETKRLVVDVKTTGARRMEADLVGISLSPGPGEAFYLPIAHQPAAGGVNLPLEQVQAALGRALADPGLEKVAHNGNHVMIVLGEHGLPMENLATDTMIAAFLLGEKGLALPSLAFNQLGIEMTPISELTGTGSKALTMDRVPIDQVSPYVWADVDLTARLAEALEGGLKKEGLWDLYRDVEMPLVPVLVQMERWGVAMDTEVLAVMARELNQRLGELQTEIYGQVGHDFNINSTQQLGQILFEELQLPHGRKTKSGWSTDARVLESLRGVHPLVASVLEYRQLAKLKSTYVDALPGLVNTKTGRVHTSYNQTGAATGRISSQDPNLQNIPIRTQMGRRIRTAFVVEGACKLVAADYSQVELRVLAQLSGDQALIDAFLADEDIHTSTASTVFGVAPGDVTSDHRRIAKVVNFGIVYGLSGFGLTQAIPGMARAEAEEFIQTYFAKYPGIRQYIGRTIRDGGE